MPNERKTAKDAFEAYIASGNLKITHEVIDAFFEGYKAGIADGAGTTLEVLERKATELPS